MKKFLLLASALLILGGCSIDNIEVDNKKENPPGEQLRITADYASVNEDEPANAVPADENGPWRVAYNDPFDPSTHLNPEDHPAIDVVWAQDDKIKVYDFTDKDSQSSAEFTLQSGQGSKLGEFTGTNPQKAEGNQLKAIYPSKSSYDSHWDYIKMEIVGQIQNGNKNMDHIAPYDYMIGDVVLTDADGGGKAATISFKRQIAIMKFVLTLPADIGTPEQLVVSTANQSFVTSQTIGTNRTTKASTLTLGLSNMTIGAGEPLVAYLAVLPFSLAGEEFNIKVVGSAKHYQGTVPTVTKTYEAGEQYIGYMGVGNFTDVTPSDPVAINTPTGDINGSWAQIGGLKVTREGADVPGVTKTKAEMSRGSADMTGGEPIELIGGDVVELLANNNSSGGESGGYGGFWIDWNRDGIMDNSTEAIIFPGTRAGDIAAGAENVLMYSTGTYTIPDNKADGTYYGRVMRGHAGLTDYVTAGENCTYIDFAIDYRQVDVVPPGDPIANFVNPSDAAVNILNDDVTRTFTVRLNKKVESTPVEITLQATTSNDGHNGILGSATITIPVGSKDGSGTITFAKTDFATPGTDDATVTVTMASIIGGVLGTDRVSIDYNVKVVDTSNMIEYTFNSDYYYGNGDDIAEITSGGYYGLVFRATNGTIPDGTVVTLNFSGNNGSILWSEDQFQTSSNGFPQTLTISESNRIFIIGVWYSNSNGTLTVTSETLPTTPAEGIKINIP